MSNNLLIVGAGEYSAIAYEIAKSMNWYDEIGFVDDNVSCTPFNIPVLGALSCIEELSDKFENIVFAIGNPIVKSKLFSEIEKNKRLRIATLISPLAFVSSSAKIEAGTIVEPFGVISSMCKVGKGCIVSAGGVVNHNSECGDFVHVDCNATIESRAKVPKGTKVCCGEVYSSRERS